MLRKFSLSSCLISIVTWLLIVVAWKEKSVFTFRSSTSDSICFLRTFKSEHGIKTLNNRPYTKARHRELPTKSFPRIYTFASKSGVLLTPNDTSIDELGQLMLEPNGAVHLRSVTDSYIEHEVDRNNGCMIELIEPETNCTVRIIGVFHGSQSSSNDVRQYISPSTNIIVLELCSDRYRDLILKKSSKTLQKERSLNSDCEESVSDEEESGVVGTGSESTSNNNSSRSWFEQYMRVVGDTINRQGWRTGIVVAIFGIVNGFQEQILQLQPGLEFITASEISSNVTIPIILADQDVSVTLQRIGQMPHVTYHLWYNFIRSRSWTTSFGPLAYATSVAVFGGWLDIDNNQKPKLLSLPQFLIRSNDAIQDLLRFVGLPLLMIQVLNAILSMQDSPSAINDAVVDLNMPPDDLLITTSINVVVILLFYLCVALPATQVILIERDDVLTEGIRTACRLAIKSKQLKRRNELNESHHKSEVAVVLGLLHVNGVALRLSKQIDQK